MATSEGGGRGGEGLHILSCDRACFLSPSEGHSINCNKIGGLYNNKLEAFERDILRRIFVHGRGKLTSAVREAGVSRHNGLP